MQLTRIGPQGEMRMTPAFPCKHKCVCVTQAVSGQFRLKLPAESSYEVVDGLDMAVLSDIDTEIPQFGPEMTKLCKF